MQSTDQSAAHVLAEVIAFEGAREVARADIEIQVRDDPAEFRDPRPDPDRLAALAEGSGGQVIHDSSSLAALLRAAKRSPSKSVVSPGPDLGPSARLGTCAGLARYRVDRAAVARIGVSVSGSKAPPAGHRF